MFVTWTIRFYNSVPNALPDSPAMSRAPISTASWCMYVYMCVCMYVCMYVYVHVCMYVYVHMHIYTCICMYVYIYIYIYIYNDVGMYTYEDEHDFLICAFVRTSPQHPRDYIYIYIYICIVMCDTNWCFFHMHACKYIFLWKLWERVDLETCEQMRLDLYVCMKVCMHACMCACMSVCMSVCMYVCIQG